MLGQHSWIIRTKFLAWEWSRRGHDWLQERCAAWYVYCGGTWDPYLRWRTMRHSPYEIKRESCFRTQATLFFVSHGGSLFSLGTDQWFWTLYTTKIIQRQYLGRSLSKYCLWMICGKGLSRAQLDRAGRALFYYLYIRFASVTSVWRCIPCYLSLSHASLRFA